MVIRNGTRGTVLDDSVRLLNTWGEMAQGLVGSKEARAVFLKTRWGIHTIGVRFPINVIVFDDLNVVRALRTNMKPFRFFFWNPKWRNVLELPAGTIAATRTEIGDTLRIK